MMFEYIAIIVAFLLGIATGYLLTRSKKPIGTLKLYEDEEGSISAFLELEQNMDDIQKLKTVILRVKNRQYY